MAKKLMHAAVERLAAAPEGKRVEKPDALAPGLVLRINDAGRKDWMVRYRLQGKQRKPANGTWPAIGIPEARNRAHMIRDTAGQGVDPRPSRR